MSRIQTLCLAFCVFVALVGLSGCPPEAMLRLVFDQTGFGQDAYVSILDGVDHAPSPQAADQFTLEDGRSEVALVQWWGTQNVAIEDPDDFLIRIFEDDGFGKPRPEPLYSIPVGEVCRDDTGRTAKPEVGSPPIYEYSIELIPFDLEPGVPYYLSILNTTGHDWVWMWTDEVGGAQVAYARTADGGVWSPSLTHDVAFRLWR